MPQLDKFIFFSQYFWLFLLLFSTYFFFIKWVLPSTLRSIKGRKLHLLLLKRSISNHELDSTRFKPSVLSNPLALAGLGVLTVGVASSRLFSLDRFSVASLSDAAVYGLNSSLPRLPSTLLQPFPTPLYEQPYELYQVNRLLRLQLASVESPWRFYRGMYGLPRLQTPFLTRMVGSLLFSPVVGLGFFVFQRQLFQSVVFSSSIGSLLRLLSFFYFELYSTFHFFLDSKLDSSSSLFTTSSFSVPPLSSAKFGFSRLSGFYGF